MPEEECVMRLMILFSSFSKEQLSADCLYEIKEIAYKCFLEAYEVSSSDISIVLGKAQSAKYDIVLSFDEYPIIGVNSITKKDKFKDLFTEKLYSILPSECCYSGRVCVCLDSAINNYKPYESKQHETKPNNEYEVISQEFVAQQPKFTFDRLVLSEDVHQRIVEQICILENRDKLFNQWGLSAIASPSVLLNLYGDSGTGKSMAAEAIADRLGKKILRASYADIESKYHGEGPKRLNAIFLAATKQDAILFIDEADSLLSARLSNVTQGSEQAINSMRSQLLINLENHDGIVIFATNLIENYDKAFKTRLLSIEMKRPDATLRKKIWHSHLYPVGEGSVKLNIPLASDIDIGALAEFDFCGRDIRNAVKQACISVVVRGDDIVCQNDLLNACVRIKNELDALNMASNKNGPEIKSLTKEEENKIAEQIKERFSSSKK